MGKENLAMKPEQLEAVRQVSLGKDVFLWQPTGFGKSLCYELLPFVTDFWRGKHCKQICAVLPATIARHTLHWTFAMLRWLFTY